MPEPGVNDRNFNRPTTTTPRGPVGNRPGGRRPRLPGEYAEFRLEDGRYLGEVLEPDFFGPESGHVTEEQREDLRVGNYAPARYGRDDPDRFAAQAGLAMPEDDNDAQFVNLPFGPEDGEGENGASGFPVARPRPSRGPAEEPDNARGFRMLDLPLTAEGTVDEDALVPAAVYRIPDSAGGGSGRWTNGLFYNFDGKADWNSRSAADLDAYSGASDGATPEERWAKLQAEVDEGLNRIKAGSAFTPAIKPTETELNRFNEADRRGIRAVGGDDEVVFNFGEGEGKEFLILPDDAAGYVVRNWEKYESRLSLLAKLQDETLTPQEQRRLVEEEVYSAVREAESRGSRLPVGRRAAAIYRSRIRELRRVAEARLQAYDDLVEAIDSGASDEKVTGLLENFQQAMLPELLGWGPVLGDIVKDLIPGLSNVRSALHAWNDLVEIAEEWEEGDVLGLIGNGGMLVLDVVGMIPVVGSAAAPVRTALKSGAKGAVRTLARTAAGRIATRWIARRRLARYLTTAASTLKSRSIEDYFGKVWNDLPPNMQEFLNKRFAYFVGSAGESAAKGEVRRAGFALIDKEVRSPRFKLPHGLSNGPVRGRRARVYDFLTEEDFKKVWGGFVVPGKKGEGIPFGGEVKVNLSEYHPHQELADSHLKRTSQVSGTEVFRLPAEVIKPEHLADAVQEWLSQPWRSGKKFPGGVPKAEVERLIAELQKTGDMTVGELFGLVLFYTLTRAVEPSWREFERSAGKAGIPEDERTIMP